MMAWDRVAYYRALKAGDLEGMRAVNEAHMAELHEEAEKRRAGYAEAFKYRLAHKLTDDEFDDNQEALSNGFAEIY